MFLFLLAVLATAFLEGCCAFVSLGWTHEDGPLGVRQYLENVDSSMNGTTPHATIMALDISEDKQSYYTLVMLGNMSFRVAIDTGSADFWLVSSACTSDECSEVPRYQLAYESSTFVSVNGNNTLFNVSYEDTTTASGFIARETVIFQNLTVPNQAFGLMNSSNVTLNDDISGVLGLGFSRLSDISEILANATPVFASMAGTGLLDYPLFGLSLSTGTLTFGAIDATVVENRSLIEWHDVVPFAPYNGSDETTASYLQWVIELSSISVNGTGITPEPTYSQSASNHSLALFDVGTSGIYGPYQDVSRIFDKISGSRLVSEDGYWAMPCDAGETISFNFGTGNFTLQPTDYLIGPTSGDPDYCIAWPAATAPSSDGIDWQLGTPFLRTVYSIYSFGIDSKEAPMVGLYPLNQWNATVESASEISSYFSTASATVDTVLPNSLLSTPTYTTPAYLFNTSVTAPLGLVVSSGLATSTYSPALGTATVNASAIPTLDPSPTLFTFLITESGSVSTSVSTASQFSAPLGEPPGWTSGTSALRVPFRLVLFACFVLLLNLAC